jgi:hypothetical protein
MPDDRPRRQPPHQPTRIDDAMSEAIAAGHFDDLALAGKPLPNLGTGRLRDDWWLQQLVEREELTGLAPPALALKAEDRELDATLDREFREAEVRRIVDDFNARVRRARMQLMGGPPVVTRTRDADDEVRRWRARREERAAAALAERERADVAAAAATPTRRRWPWSRRPADGGSTPRG